MSEIGKVVFLSYASQDAEAARKICESLRQAGVDVWFAADGGLEHGDEWDAKIRRLIGNECVMFIPLISANTQARHEGYFRLEWELAAERAMSIASGVPFILPVVIDDTREPDALVPDRFKQESASEAQRFDRARVRYLAGRYAEAQAEGEALVREKPDNLTYRGFVGSCAARLGDTEGARAALTWLRAVDKKYRFGHHVYLQARIAALLGQRDAALRLLREAMGQFAAAVMEFNPIPDFLLDPDFEPLASDPEFKAILAPKG